MTSGSDSVQTEVAAILPVGEVMGYCCFVVVAEELHFTRSSHRLRMDQSVVSRHIQKLESNLGLKLFVRGDRRVELTDAGRAFLPYARKALIAAKAGARIAQAVGRGEPQELEVAYSTLVDAHLIAQIKVLAEGARPAIPVRFHSTPPDKLVERLFEGKSHLAITLLPVEAEVVSTCLLREELFAIVPAEHRLARRSSLTISEIGSDPVVWGYAASAPALTNDLFKRFRNAGYIPNVTHEAQTIAESLGLAREGLGITFVKTSDRHLIGEG
ncbi:MAG TPA: LysR family transcriptional regulator, partial [Bryobacteraceae bacterium]|nr:LysR family transcriptional regulator [Bryobacteraceae bacterium]